MITYFDEMIRNTFTKSLQAIWKDRVIFDKSMVGLLWNENKTTLWISSLKNRELG